MNRKYYLSIAAILLAPSLVFGNPAKKGYDIAVKVSKANDGFKGEQSTMQMILINAYGDKIVRKMTSKTKEMSSDGDKSIIEFVSPADVRKTRLLTWAHKKKDDSQWLYLPKSKKIKRISSRSKSGAFMGSEFSYEDLGSQEVEKFKHKFIKDGKFKGRDVWITERVPVDPESGYSKQVSIVDKKMLVALKIEYYDRKGELLKIGTFGKFKKYGKYWRAGTLRMKNIQTKKESVLIWKNRIMNKSFSDAEFTSAKLTK